MPLVDLGVDLCLKMAVSIWEKVRVPDLCLSRPASQPQTVGGPTAPPTPAGRFADGLTEVVGRAEVRVQREAGVLVERLQGASVTSADPEPLAPVDAQEVHQVSHDELLKIAVGKSSTAHPLLQVGALTLLDKLNLHDAVVKDHGSWGGRWPLPTQPQWKVVESLGLQRPCSKNDCKAHVVEAAGKEWSLSQMNPSQKMLFCQAALKIWSVWQDISAPEIFSPDESAKSWQS